VFVVTHPETGKPVGDFRLWWPYVTGASFEQRNSLVVGFMMGFAVIPIVFTITEDFKGTRGGYYISGDMDDHTGAVRCLDPEFKHQAVVSYRSPFHRIVFPSKRGNPFTGQRGNSGTVTPKPPQEKGSNVEVGDTNATKKKGRGRPKGAKNRPKEVVAAEKAARAEEKLAKLVQDFAELMANEGSLVNPTHNWFLSTAHTAADIDETLEHADAAFRTMANTTA
jgi:hypothetical protein